MNLQILILFIFFIQSNPVELRPAKSLDQPAGDLEWEAWLLRHDSRPKLGKITPKSIFTVRPHSTVMPPCAEGYQSDAMGRCVTKIDKNAHYEFLVQKLNSNVYDPSDYEDFEEDVDTPTTGPFQINIPIEKSVEIDSGTNDTGNFTVVVAPLNDMAMNLTSINDSLNIISLTKELLKNLTTEVKVKPLERNETVISLLDDFIQNDQPPPPIERDTQDEDNSHDKNINQNQSTEKSVQDKTEADFNIDDPKTIIILFHALPNTTLNNRTNQEDVTSTTESSVTTTEFNNNSATTDFDEYTTKATTVAIEEETTPVDVYQSDAADNVDISDQSTAESIIHEDFDTSRIGLLNTYPKSGDFKTSFFQLRWNDSDGHKTEYNHRSRDRNWYNPVFTSPETTSERINSRYSSHATDLNPYRRIFRKTLQDTDRIINTRRWSNR